MTLKKDIRTLKGKSYAFTTKEVEVDNAIFQIMDKGDREEKERLLKLLNNRLKILKKTLKK